MKYRLKGNELTTFTHELDELINNELDEKIRAMGPLARKTVWQGPARNAFVKEYENVMYEIRKIPQLLFLYTDYLNKVINNYDDTLNDVNNNMNKIEQKVDGGNKK